MYTMTSAEKLIKKKCQLIHEINDTLVRFDKHPINGEDFDILWELDLEDLYHAQSEVTKQLEHYATHAGDYSS